MTLLWTDTPAPKPGRPTLAERFWAKVMRFQPGPHRKPTISHPALLRRQEA